jgi:hypothetical protein
MKPPAWMRLTRRPAEPAPRVVTIAVTADVTKFVAAMEGMSRSLRLMVDRADIRAIARAELAAARAHLKRHVDGLYADLGIDRDPHITRGSE